MLETNSYILADRRYSYILAREKGGPTLGASFYECCWRLRVQTRFDFLQEPAWKRPQVGCQFSQMHCWWRNRLRVQLTSNRDLISWKVLWNLGRLGYGRQVVSWQTTKDLTARNSTTIRTESQGGRRGRPVWEDRPGLRNLQSPSTTRVKVGWPVERHQSLVPRYAGRVK